MTSGLKDGGATNTEKKLVCEKRLSVQKNGAQGDNKITSSENLT